jgi:hypothetical protein
MPTAAKGNGKYVRPARPPVAMTASPKDLPNRFTYALKAWTAERRKDGWYVSPTMPTLSDEKPQWRGPFETIETACLSMARGLAVEIADRHTRHIEWHKLDGKHPLYGLRPETRLKPPRRKASVT